MIGKWIAPDIISIVKCSLIIVWRIKKKIYSINLEFDPKLVKADLKNPFDSISYWNGSTQESVLICVIPQKYVSGTGEGDS